MKTLFISLLFVITIQLSAQYHYDMSEYKTTEMSLYNERDTWLPAVVLVGTFVTVQSVGGNVNVNQRAVMAFTGMATSVISYYIVKRIRKRIRR